MSPNDQTHRQPQASGISTRGNRAARQGSLECLGDLVEIYNNGIVRFCGLNEEVF